MATSRVLLACLAVAVCACSAHAHLHGAPRLAAVAGAAPDSTNTSTATGSFFVDVDDPAAQWNMTLRGIPAADIMTPSLHQSPSGSNSSTAVGPEIVALKYSPANVTSSPDGTVVLKGSFTAADMMGPLKGQPFDALHARLHNSQVYVVVPTKQHPAGDIKGPISPKMLSAD